MINNNNSKSISYVDCRFFGKSIREADGRAAVKPNTSGVVSS